MDTSLSNHCHLDNGDANPHPVADLAPPDARPLSHATKAVNDSPLKINSDSSGGKDKLDDKSKSHKHHHHHHHHRDDKKEKHHDKSKGDRPKDKHREHEKNHDKSKDKDRHKDKEKSKDDKSKSDRPKDKHSSKDEKHRSEKHDALKNVMNSPSKPKDHHSSLSSQKLKENSHVNSSSKDSSKHKDGLSSPKDEARLKEKINNHHSSSSSHKTKVSNSTSGTSSSHSHSSKDKSKDSSKSEKSEKSDKERSESKHRSKDGSSSHKDGSSSSHKPKVAEGEEKKSHKSDKDKESHKSDKESHKSDKDKEKRKEHDKHKDEKRKEEKKHKEKENREKSKDKVHEHKPNKIKEEEKHKPHKIKVEEEHKVNKIKEEDDERPPTPDIKLEPEDSSPAKEEKSWNCVDGIKQESQASDDDDVPLAARAAILPNKVKKEKKENKRVVESDSEDEPLSARISKAKKFKPAPVNRKRKMSESDDEPEFKKKKKNLHNKKIKQIPTPTSSPTKKRTKKEEEEQHVWKWWEEEKLDEGVKWKFLEHKGPVFAPNYEPLPPSVKFYYDGKEMKLSPAAEEVATFYARMLDHDYTTKEAFNTNFFKDWYKVMTKEEKEHITDLRKCNFRRMADYFTAKSEERKAMTKEEKQVLKKQNEEMTKEYGFCNIDGHVEKIGNFKIEPPGLFRGRGDHPKMGMLKKRTMPENVIINCSKDSNIPKPPEGHKWKEVRHDNTVTWLACWTESIQGQTKYVMLNASSKLKGEKDWQKYEKARELKKHVHKIREQYQFDWKSKEMKVRQRAVALYFIDKLALRAGNEKEEGETADTVGCCSLRVEHIKLHESDDRHMVDFDFLGKDSIRYQNTVQVEKRVYKNLQLFMDNKAPEDDLFDRLNTTILNKHLNELMDGLTAKVFRTYNASKTLQEQLDKLTNPDDPIAAKLLSYNRANRAVAILCNHQRAVPKTFGKSMENLQNKISAKKEQVDEVERELRDLKKSKHRTGEAVDKKKKALDRLREQLHKLEVQATDKEENKDIALGTSKLNYLDPRISVAWCKKFEVPIEKVYNKTQRDKFRWAIDMAGPDYEF